LIVIEPGEPVARHPLQVISPEHVHALAPPGLDAHQPGRLELAEMAGDGGPRAVEAGRDLARGHLAAPGVEHGEDRPPGLVGEGVEDGVEVLEVDDALRLGAQ
jgi:hypothetical protein